MCFLVLGYLKNGTFICGFNRDEYYARSWEPTHYQQEQGYLGGKDLKSGGTWLAINKNLYFLAITNIRLSGNRKFKIVNQSRGGLARDFFSSGLEPKDWLSTLTEREDPNYYNVVLGSISNGSFYHACRLNNDFYSKKIKLPFCISNAGQHEQWEKVDRGQAIFNRQLNENIVSHDSVHQLLKDSTKSTNIPDTGYPYYIEQLLSSIFIKSAVFGTVTSTSIMVDPVQYEMSIKEVGFVTNGVEQYTNEFQHKMSKP